MAARFLGLPDFEHGDELNLEDGTSVRNPSPIPGHTGAVKYSLLEPLWTMETDWVWGPATVAALARELRVKHAYEIVPDAQSAEDALAGLDEEEHEYLVITRNGNHSVWGWGDKPREYLKLDTLAKYCAFRNHYFGHRKEYLEFAERSDEQFNDASNAVLQELIDGGGLAEKNALKEWQKILYRWVRAAYSHKPERQKQEWRHVDEDKVAKHIKDHDTFFNKTLRGQAKHIIDASGKKFEFDQRLVVRPENVPVMLLGSVSQHSEAHAIDVDPDNNPQIHPDTWTWLEKFVGMPTITKDLARWNANPMGLYKDVKKLSDGFVEKAKAEVKRWQELVARAHVIERELALAKETAARRALGPTPAQPEFVQPEWAKPEWDKPSSVPEYATLQLRYDKGIPESISDEQAYAIIFENPPKGMNKVLAHEFTLVKRGFMSLTPEVVQGFSDLGYRWGVTFTDLPDLMHFQKPEDPPPAKP